MDLYISPTQLDFFNWKLNAINECKCYLTGPPLFKDSCFALWMISRQVVIKQKYSLKTGPKIIYVDVSIGSEYKKTLTRKTPERDKTTNTYETSSQTEEAII